MNSNPRITLELVPIDGTPHERYLDETGNVESARFGCRRGNQLSDLALQPHETS